MGIFRTYLGAYFWIPNPQKQNLPEVNEIYIITRLFSSTLTRLLSKTFYVSRECTTLAQYHCNETFFYVDLILLTFPFNVSILKKTLTLAVCCKSLVKLHFFRHHCKEKFDLNLSIRKTPNTMDNKYVKIKVKHELI